MVNVQQMRAARALLGWSQEDLATRAGLGRRAVADIERQVGRPEGPHGRTLERIDAAFQEAGITFVNEDGVIGVLLASDTGAEAG